MPDNYTTYPQLAKCKCEGIHYRIVSRSRHSGVLVAAPHGGHAEPRTAMIAKAIAGTRHSLYVFEALIRGLHITSHRFNEPRAIAAANAHAKVVTIHGCKNSRSPTTDVFVGGLDTTIRNAVIEALRSAGFAAAIDNCTTGRSQANICNKGRSGAGIQLEITRRLRTRLGRPEKSSELRRFARAIGSVLNRVKA